MADFVAKAPNDKYDGRTLGVKFEDGVARVNNDTVPDKLGRPPEVVAGLMAQEYGYEVKDSAGRTIHTVPQMPWKSEEQPQPSSTGEGASRKK